MSLAKSDSVGIVFSFQQNTPPTVNKIIRGSVADNTAIRRGLYLLSINGEPVKPTIGSKELKKILAAASTADADSISLDLFDPPRDGKLITVSLPLSEKKRRSQEAERLRDEKLDNPYTLLLNPESINRLYWVDLGNESHVELNETQKLRLLKLIKSSGAKYANGEGLHPSTFFETNTLEYEDSGQLDTVLEGLKEVKSGKGIIKIYKSRGSQRDESPQFVEPEVLMGGKKRTIRKKNRKGTRRATRTTRATRANQRKNRRMRKNSRKSRKAR